jgi:predicted RNase H-like nuclease (RuvC/YqgF family)
MLKVDTTIKRIRGTDYCQRGHSRWGYVPKKKARYCLDCESYRQMRRDYKRGIIGGKAVLLLEEALDFQVSTLEAHIVELKSKVEELRDEKDQLRKTYEDKLEKRRKAKSEKGS